MKLSSTLQAAFICCIGFCTVSTNNRYDACGGVLTQAPGVITSPLYPNKYPANSYCTWSIEPPRTSRITLSFTHFQLYPDDRDGLHVSGQNSTGWQTLGSFHSSFHLPSPLTFEGTKIKLHFTSNSFNEYPGFSLQYSFTDVLEEVGPAREDLHKWFMSLRKAQMVHEPEVARTSKWGHQLPRIAVALFLADRGSFQPEDRSMDEMNYELSIQLLSKMLGGGLLKRRDLSLYIHALMVTCGNPRNFHGRDLVAELRANVESSNGTDIGPFELLVLCNAGDAMTNKDVDRIAFIFDSQHRPFWTDNQALASLALACVSVQRETSVDERTQLDMAQELKKRQFRNGTVDNLKTTALVLQALVVTRSEERDFDFWSAVRSLVSAQKEDGSVGSVLESYYVLPVLSNATLLDVTDRHCARTDISESEALNKLQSSRGRRVSVQYSVVIGTDEDLTRIWNLKVPANSSLYDVIETVQKLDSRQRVEYNVIEGKPFVSSVMGVQDDAELGLYWFTYARRRGSEDAVLLVDSPVDVKIEANQELVLWYKTGQWNKPVSS